MTSELFPTFSAGRARVSTWLAARRWRLTPILPLDSRSTQQRGLLRMLHRMAVEQLPQALLVRHLAADHRGIYRMKLESLSDKLASGTPLADAVEQTPGCLSPEQTLAVRYGAHLGILPQALGLMVDEAGIATTRVTGRINHAIGYFLAVLLVSTLVTMFIMTHIVPKFAQIFSEFGMETTPALVRLLSISGFLSEFWYLIAIAFLASCWFFCLEPGWRYFHNNLLPWLSSSASKLRGADVLSLLAITEQAGRPLAGAMSVLARYHFDRRIRGQLLFVRNEMEQGAPVWQSMVKAKLLSPSEANAITEAPDAASRIWSINQLATVRRQQVANRIDTLAHVLHPLAILVLAAGVFMVAAGVLTPLFYMIQSLS